MFAAVNSATISGLAVQMVQVETDVSDGLPGLNLIGYLAAEVKEAGARVRSAINNSGIILPPSRIVVSLAPADIPKRGALLDLPIAVSILAAMNKIPAGNLMSSMIIGEVSLKGTVDPVKGVLLMVQEAKRSGLTQVVIPSGNVREARLIPDINIIGVSNISETIDYLRYGIIPEFCDDCEFGNKVSDNGEDFSDVLGQEQAKRAALISACGYHNLFLLGPPGSGKTMIASRLRSIMPPMSYEESIELSGIYSAAGLLPEGKPFMDKRPFRDPHHTITPSALVGGGINPRPGEVTLANHGVLFLDELTEFRRVVLELLRQPLEEHKVHVSRVNATYTFPADFLLVAAANPCPCGYYPDFSRCHCRDGDIRRYLGKLSGPLLDRIDMCIRVEPVKFDALFAGKTGCELKKHEKTDTSGVDSDCRKENDKTCMLYKNMSDSESMRDTVLRVWKLQQERFKDSEYSFNGRIPAGELNRWCVISDTDREIMKQAYNRLRLSARAFHRILRVARTIADIDGRDDICNDDLMEALGYRMDINIE